MPVSRTDVLRLYKNILKYSKSLQYTDPVYFKRRIVKEFHNKKTLTDPEEIEFAYKKGEAFLRKGSVV